MQSSKTFYRLALLTTVLALAVVVLGAYVRLSHAGLGCPDWPGCYGHLDVPEHAHEVERANQAYPERPVEAHKAWKEMIHRYLAGTLGLLIVVLAILAWRARREPGQPVALPAFLVALVVFQALLGMWTVTLLLFPAVVMGHLLGGLTTLALLWLMTARLSGWFDSVSSVEDDPLRPWAVAALVVVIVQIALGGWTSANYAALACPDFPTCQGQWWPQMDFREGFTFLRELGVDYEGGVLENPARMAIHVAHRVGALVTFLLVGYLALRTIVSAGSGQLKGLGVFLLVVLGVQVSLGIANVQAGLPLPVAVAHNAVAALLLLTVVTLNLALFPGSRRA
jgi:cytochrome c oxidase assembly protein subunit 15